MEILFHKFNHRTPTISLDEARRLHENGEPYVAVFENEGVHLKIWPALSEVAVNYVFPGRAKKPRLVYRFSKNSKLGFHLSEGARFSREEYRNVPIRKVTVFENKGLDWERIFQNSNIGESIREPVTINDESLLQSRFPSFGSYMHLLSEHHPAIWNLMADFQE